MEIGIFGGSFDPIHTGHAMVASYMAQCAGLDEVWLMVSPENPLKSGRRMAPEPDRLAMCGLVAAESSRLRVCDLETRLPLPSYTYRTLERLREQYPQHRFHLLVGADNWLLFDRWKNGDDILRHHPVIVYPRPGYPVDTDKLPDGVEYISDCPQAFISSTFVRECVGKNLSPAFFVPVEVARYIGTHHLYEDGK